MPLVRLFGTISDIARWTEKTVPGETLGALKAAVAEEDARLQTLLRERSTLVIVNHTLIPASLRRDDQPIAPEDEVAFGSPVGGG